MTLEQRLRSMRETMRDMFGIARLRAGKEEIICSVLERRDTLATMPTGAGQSLCYQLPALHLDGTTLVVSPLIAMMKDQADKLLAAGVDCTLVNSSWRSREEREALQRILDGKGGIVFVTPERLAQPAFMKVLRAGAGHRVGLVVVDEAHCVSQWGHDFRPAFLEIASAVKAHGQPPVRRAGEGWWRQKWRRAGRTGQARAAARSDRVDHGAGIIYTATVRDPDEIYAWLAEAGESVSRYHGKLAPSAREAASGNIHVGSDKVNGGHQRVRHGY